MLYIALSFIVMSLQWSVTDILLDIKQKIVSLWFEGKHAEDLLTDFLHQRHLLKDVSSNIYNIEPCKQ